MTLIRTTIVVICVVAVVGCDPERPTRGGKPTTIIDQTDNEQTDGSNVTASGEAVANSHLENYSDELAAFLIKFDQLSNRGFVPSLRKGSTGIGYTLETMLGIEENNSKRGDFLGMEIKAHRDDDPFRDDSRKMNLFLKEPKWLDELRHAQRIRLYGYLDDNGRTALYSTVTIEPSSHQLGFRVDQTAERLLLQRDGTDVAYWAFDVLDKRLQEKLGQTVFVGADSKMVGDREQFHYRSVTWCRGPSVERFIELIEQSAVMLELRMHLKPTGGVRNHGSAFRIKENRIPDLFDEVLRVRPLDHAQNSKPE